MNLVLDDRGLTFDWLAAAESYFEQQRIFLDYPNKIAGVIREGERVHIPLHVKVERYANMARGRFISAGAFSYCRSANMPHDFQLGRYCSVGPSAMLGYQEHPIDRVSTHPFTTHAHMARMARDEFGTKIRQQPHVFSAPAPEIGSDVWIGAQSILKRGIKIGHGAVIATRAFVAKDVPPYAVVGGLPARVIKYRFDETTIERLLTLQWWDYNFADFADLDTANVPDFISALEDRISSGGISPMDNEPIALAVALHDHLTG